MVETPVSRWDYREIIPVVKKGGWGGGEWERNLCVGFQISNRHANFTKTLGLWLMAFNSER